MALGMRSALMPRTQVRYSSGFSRTQQVAVPQHCRLAVTAATASGRGQGLGEGNEGVEKVWAKVDALNANDPKKIKIDGLDVPYTLAYSKWLTNCINQLVTSPSAEALIVGRGLTVEHWKLPRSKFPEGKSGYFRWRYELEQYHANTLATIMEEEGFDETARNKVKAIVQKESKDEEVKLLEEALCLVFLQHQLTEARTQQPDDVLIDVLRRTFSKMDAASLAVTLELAKSLPVDEQALVLKAFQPPPPPPPKRETIRDMVSDLA